VGWILHVGYGSRGSCTPMGHVGRGSSPIVRSDSVTVTVTGRATSDYSEAWHLLSECPCVCPSVTLLGHAYGSRCRNKLHIVRERDVSSYLKPNFAILNLGVHTNECIKERLRKLDQ